MEWKWPSEHGVDCKDYHPRWEGGLVATGGAYGGGCSRAGDSTSSGVGDTFHSKYPNHGLNHKGDYIDFIFTFEDANTWVSGYRQMGSNALGNEWLKAKTKDIQISTSNDRTLWTLVKESTNKDPSGNTITDTHSTWNNCVFGAQSCSAPAFSNDGTTTEWTPKAPSKYLRVRTLSNYGDTSGYRLVVRFLQLKFAVWPN